MRLAFIYSFDTLFSVLLELSLQLLCFKTTEKHCAAFEVRGLEANGFLDQQDANHKTNQRCCYNCK